MSVTVTQANKITLLVGTDQIECQVISHNLQDADPSAGEVLRTGCGDIVKVPADSTELGTLDLTLLPERGVDAFVAWTWQMAGGQAAFKLVVNPTEATAMEWSGSLTVAAIPEKQDEYTKIETVDVSWSVTSWTHRGTAVTP